MSLARVAGTALVAVVLNTLSASPVQAQQTVTICKDGTRLGVSGADVCRNHGGIDSNRTVAARRGMSSGGVTQPSSGGSSSASTTTGLPLPAGTRVERKPGTQDPNGRDEDRNRTANRDQRRADERGAPHSASARCVDGTYAHSNGNPKNVCKHHGGVARWLEKGKGKSNSRRSPNDDRAHENGKSKSKASLKDDRAHERAESKSDRRDDSRERAKKDGDKEHSKHNGKQLGKPNGR